MKNARRALVLPLCLLLAAVFCLPASAVTYKPDGEISAQAYYLYNLDTEKLVAEENSQKQLYPASLTKIMTCILALEKTDDLDAEKITYPTYVQDYLYTYQWGPDGHGAVSLGDLRAGEQLTMRQLLYALMLPSANEAAMIIADHLGGSQEAFAELMNARAKELGAKNTNFVNPNGLFDAAHVTTAEDMAMLAMHAYELPGFMDIVSAISYDSGPTNMRENVTWDSTNRMQDPNSEKYYYAGLRGMKTGSVPEAGSCFVSTCTRDGFTYLLVVMGSPYLDENGAALDTIGSFADTKTIYDWVFDNFRRKSLVDKGMHVGEVELKLSTEQDHLKLMTGERFTALVPKSTEVTDVDMVTEIPDSVSAPIEKNEYIGELSLRLAGEEIGRVPLLAAETVEASTILVVWENIKGVMSSFWFKFVVALIVLLIVAYIVLVILRNRGRRTKNYRPRRRL